jgi:hypothetical protein
MLIPCLHHQGNARFYHQLHYTFLSISVGTQGKGEGEAEESGKHGLEHVGFNV